MTVNLLTTPNMLPNASEAFSLREKPFMRSLSLLPARDAVRTGLPNEKDDCTGFFALCLKNVVSRCLAVDRGSCDRGKSALPVRIASRDDAARLYLGSGDIIKVSPAHVFLQSCRRTGIKH